MNLYVQPACETLTMKGGHIYTCRRVMVFPQQKPGSSVNGCLLERLDQCHTSTTQCVHWATSKNIIILSNISEWTLQRFLAMYCVFFRAIITSSHSKMVRGLHNCDLLQSHVRVSHLCRSYQHFCRCGKLLDSAMESAGAKCIAPRMDVNKEDWAAVDTWINLVITAMASLALTPIGSGAAAGMYLSCCMNPHT